MLRAMRPGLALFIALVPVLATGVRADTPVSPSEFRDYAEGYTLYFEQDGEPAGAEAFGPEGRVTWRTPEGICIEGLWRAYEEDLCFYYGIDDIVECWQVLRDSRGLKVRRTGDEAGEAGDTTYRITGRDRRPLHCTGQPGLPTSMQPGGVMSPAPPR